MNSSNLTVRSKETRADGTVEEGEFEFGQLHGFGKRVYCNGVVMEGRFVNGELKGYGKVVYPDGRVWEGRFKRFLQSSILKDFLIIKDKINDNNNIAMYGYTCEHSLSSTIS
jgi:hypothetical protein